MLTTFVAGRYNSRTLQVSTESLTDSPGERVQQTDSPSKRV